MNKEMMVGTGLKLTSTLYSPCWTGWDEVVGGLCCAVLCLMCETGAGIGIYVDNSGPVIASSMERIVLGDIKGYNARMVCVGGWVFIIETESRRGLRNERKHSLPI